jgi:hypothetical protein
VSRLSYQKGYSLGNRGSSSGGVKDTPSVSSVKSEEIKPGRRSKLEQGGDFNVSYGATLPIGELTDVESFAKDKPGKSSALFKPGKPKTYAKGRK